MHRPQGTLPRIRSAFTASFLSLLFPGLGHAYAGALERAVAFAAAPLLLLSLAAGLALALKLQLLGLLLQPWALILILVLDGVAFGYRALAAIDAWRTAIRRNAEEAGAGGRVGRAPLRSGLASVAGLLAVLLVMGGGHVAVAWYDLQAYELAGCIFDPSGTADCTAVGGDASGGTGGDDSSGEVGPTEAPAASESAATPVPGATSAAPTASLPPWDGKERLNILLVGADQRPKENAFNTDTLIVVSIDPATRRVAMFQVPRDTVDVPLPPGPARAVFGRVYRGKINSLWMQALARPDLFPGTAATRGPNALKSALGELYGLDVRWYVQVNFDGFRQIVDTLGGVTVNVQMPVTDDHYPADTGRLSRVYIPAGIGRFTGSQALVYARSRHGSNDFDRGSRQQRLLVSLKEQTDFGTVVTRLPALINALKTAVHTDIPRDQLPALISLASSVDSTNIRSFVFAPPLYQQEILSGDPRGYVIVPYLDRIRKAAANAFASDPAAEADRVAIAQENASVWVLNGSGESGQAAAVAGYLESRGVNAIAPAQVPETRPSATTIVAYNGIELRAPETIALLETVFGVTVTLVDDATARADIVITTSTKTPELTPPPGP